MISFTDTARNKIKRLLEKRGGIGIRLAVKTTGCSGLAYVLEYVDAYTGDDATINYAQPDFSVLVDKKHEVYLDGMTVDYVRQGLNEGFEFSNPNERDRCGCGESFRV
ncbi:iron-sulfur cluster assembly accessory protein [Haliscomenobacter sp.]|uniref:HesB/IscA family protein n=1 Tax=Haliscomenobacter sp. TaxID=2717303 RepID=UPI003364DFDD